MHNFDGLDEINLQKTEQDYKPTKNSNPFADDVRPAGLDEEDPEKEPAVVAPFSSESTLTESIPTTIVFLIYQGSRTGRHWQKDKNYLHKRRQRHATERAPEV